MEKFDFDEDDHKCQNINHPCRDLYFTIEGTHWGMFQIRDTLELDRMLNIPFAESNRMICIKVEN